MSFRASLLLAIGSLSIVAGASATSPAMEIGYAVVAPNSEQAVAEVVARFIAANSGAGMECKRTEPRRLADLSVEVTCRDSEFTFRLMSCDNRLRCPPFRGHGGLGKWTMLAMLYPLGGGSQVEARVRLRAFVQELTPLPGVHGVNWALCDGGCLPSLF